jgi:beta-N-acetylhexosaminidase
MDLEHRVGQLLMVGVPVSDIGSGEAVVTRYHVGGIFLRGRSTAPAAVVRVGLDRLQRATVALGGVRLHVAVDQEGGQVQTLRGPDFPPIPAAVQQGRLPAAALDRQIQDHSGRLRRVGVTLDLAPVADTVPTGTEASNPPIGALGRQYGADPGAVGDDIATVVAAMQSTGVLATLKHFPGLGRVRANTDHSPGAVDPGTTADDPSLEPFRRGIAADAGAVMIASARYPRLDPGDVAVFSSAVIDGLLRRTLGFRGLVVSDDLGKAVAVRSVDPAVRATAFVAAGGDLVLTVVPEYAGVMYDALLGQAHRSASFRARVESAATSVVASKRRAGLLGCPRS